MEKLLRLKLPDGKFGNVSAKRSLAMAKVRSKGNRTTELRLRFALVQAGIRGWHLHASLPGRPDFYFTKTRIALFVDGCFWHGCPTCGHIPKTNRAFWKAKIMRNKQRAGQYDLLLKRDGVLVWHVWECELKGNIQPLLLKLRKLLRRRQKTHSPTPLLHK